METGCLLVETHPAHPGLVRVRAAAALPPLQQPNGAELRYAARFQDVEAAVMHAHHALRRRLVDIDKRLYRVEPLDAVAAVDALSLSHDRLHVDPALAESSRLVERISSRRLRQARADRAWRNVGAVALAFLLVLLLFGY